MKKTFVITDYNDGTLCVGIDGEGRTLQIDFEPPGLPSFIGNVYSGNVTNISKNPDAAFIQIPGRMVYVPYDPSAEVFFVNTMRQEGPLRQGDIVIVKITADALKTKLARGIFYIPEEDETELRDKALRCGKAAMLSDAGRQIIKEASAYENIITDYLGFFNENKAVLPALSYYEGAAVPLKTVYEIETRISKALAKKVWLPDGAYLVIEHTEALAVIDVNSGKSDAKEGFFDINLKACKEIARQIMLRRLSGIIIIDFISMKEPAQREQLIAAMRDELREDPLKPQVIDITPLGLMEITRKKALRPLYEILNIC